MPDGWGGDVSKALFLARIAALDDDDLAGLLCDLDDTPGAVDAAEKARLIGAEVRRRPLARWLEPGEDAASAEDVAWAVARRRLFGDLVAEPRR